MRSLEPHTVKGSRSNRKTSISVPASLTTKWLPSSSAYPHQESCSSVLRYALKEHGVVNAREHYSPPLDLDMLKPDGLDAGGGEEPVSRECEKQDWDREDSFGQDVCTTFFRRKN